MKKIWFIILLFLSLFTFSGCYYDEDYYLDKEVSETSSLSILQSKYDALILKKEQLENDISYYKQSINTNKQYLIQLEEQLSKVDEELEVAFLNMKTLETNIITAHIDVTQVSYNETGWWFIKFKEDKESSFGSGFIISKKDGYYYAMTNYHVIDISGNKDDNDIYVYDYQYSEYKGTVIYKNDKYDMALVRFSSSKNYKVITLAEENAKIGENVFVIGNPNGQFQSVSTGVVKNYRKVTNSDTGYTTTYDCVETSAFCLGGNSGGMMLNENFQVIGITTWGKENASYTSYNNLGSPVSIIKQFLKENNFNI